MRTLKKDKVAAMLADRPNFYTEKELLKKTHDELDRLWAYWKQIDASRAKRTEQARAAANTLEPGKKYTRQEMRELADLLMDELVEGKHQDRELDEIYAELTKGTGWSAADFAAICNLRWNGPDYVQ